MDKTSALGRAVEQEKYRRRAHRAQNAWAAEGHEGTMTCEWQELFECRSFSIEELRAARIHKLKSFRTRAQSLAHDLHRYGGMDDETTTAQALACDIQDCHIDNLELLLEQRQHERRRLFDAARRAESCK